MYKVKWQNPRRLTKADSKIFGSEPKWQFATQSGKICEFPTRQKAAQWIRNHRSDSFPCIVYPDGRVERYGEIL